MELFIIHRSKDKKQIKSLLKRSGREIKASFKLIFLDSIECEEWKEKAINLMSKAEVIIIYDRKACEKSDNARWEIDKAEESNLLIIEINPSDTSSAVCSKLLPLYELQEEFERCFKIKERVDVLDLYKLMIASSETLIQRRQRTNAFFITVLGTLLAIAGLMVKYGALHSGTIWILYGFSAVGLLLCNSWRNLIDNYGKLNKAKFDVILRLEKELDAQIYEAEWISLGKGLRPNKYRSFTTTEKNVPFYFGLLIIVLTVIAIVAHIMGWMSNGFKLEGRLFCIFLTHLKG